MLASGIEQSSLVDLHKDINELTKVFKEAR
jgi:hypothetical protein